MTSTKQLWLLAGGNGAGKSTFYRTRLKPLGLPFVNADEIAKELYADDPEGHSYSAAKVAEEMRNDLLIKGRNFCFETVFSHPSKVDFIARAKALRYQIVLVFIHLDNPALNKARVSQRVVEGGHNVPDDKVETRIPRTLQHIRTAVPLCDEVHLLDNSSAENPFQRVAKIHQGVVVEAVAPLPEWAQAIVS